MKQILTIIVILIYGLFITTEAHASEVRSASAQLAPIVKEHDYSRDIRTKAIKNVFERYGSPLVNEAVHYVRYADLYGVDWKLLPAISGLESGFGKHLMPGSHNAYGWGGGHIYFASWEEGIATINKSLSERYMARGATTVWTIGPIYAESPTWAVRVNGFMMQIEAEYKRLSLLARI